MNIFRRIERLWLDPQSTGDRIKGFLGKFAIESGIATIPATLTCLLIMAVFRTHPELQILGFTELTFTIAAPIYSFSIYSAFCTIISPDSDPYGLMADEEQEDDVDEKEDKQSELDSFDS